MRKLAGMPLVRKVWDSGRALRLHAWIYSLETGLLEERLCLDGTEAATGLEPLAA